MDPAAKCFPVPTTRVLLWSAPRCLSSVFERSIRELERVKVIYEPHQLAFYYGPERKTDANIHNPENIEPGATFEAGDRRLLAQYDGFDALFAKNLAYFIEGNYEKYIQGPFSNWKHTFLIRNPKKSTPSIYRACKASNTTFHLAASGFRQLYEFFKVVQQVDPSPLVLDADDLLENPRGILQHFCSSTGLPFHERMLTWTPGVVPDWTQSKVRVEIWHGVAMWSSGFMKPKSTPAVPLADFPEEVKQAMEDALPFYEALHSVRMNPAQ